MNFVLVSTNIIKVWELSLILNLYLSRQHADIVEIQGTPQEIVFDKVEKALRMSEFRGKVVIVEDTGIGLDALQGYPGHYGKEFVKLCSGDIYDICRKAGDFGATKTTILGIGYVMSGDGYKYTVIRTFSHTIHGTIVEPINPESKSDFAHIFVADVVDGEVRDEDVLSHYYLERLMDVVAGDNERGVVDLPELLVKKMFPREKRVSATFDWVTEEFKNRVGNRGVAGRKLLQYIRSSRYLNKLYEEDVGNQEEGWQDEVVRKYRERRFEKRRKNIQHAVSRYNMLSGRAAAG